MLGQVGVCEGIVPDEWRLTGDEWRRLPVLARLEASASGRRSGVSRTGSGVGPALAFPIQSSVAFGGGFLRAAAAVLNLDLVAMLFGGLVAAFAPCTGRECGQMGKRNCRQCCGAEMGKQVASVQSDHGAFRVGGDDALSVPDTGVGKRVCLPESEAGHAAAWGMNQLLI